MQKHLLAVLLSVISGAAAAQDSVNPKLLAPLDPALEVPVRELKVASSNLTEVPGFGSVGAAQCDRDGNPYFHQFAGSFNKMDVLKLKMLAGSAEPITYKGPE